MSSVANLFAKYLANGFADFRGLHVAGRIPVAQDVINELLAELLRQGQAGTPRQATQPDSAFSMQDLLPLVRRAEITAADGKIIVDFEISR